MLTPEDIKELENTWASRGPHDKMFDNLILEKEA